MRIVLSPKRSDRIWSYICTPEIERKRELYFISLKARGWVMMYIKLTTCLPVGHLVDIKDLPDF